VRNHCRDAVLHPAKAVFLKERIVAQRRRRAARSGVETIQDELATLGDDVASLGSTLGEVASDEARASIRSIRDRLDRIAGDAQNATRMGVGAVSDRIEANPFACVAIALGLGVVLAALMRR